MHLKTLQSTISDNYFYLVWDEDRRAVLIDPIDAKTAIAAVEDNGLTLDWVVNTHFHPDHVGGNDEVLDHFAAARLCTGPDRDLISCIHAFDRVLADGETFEVGTLRFDVIETPGHTAGHISLLLGNHLFCGDTVFVGGAGNCRFGGDPSVLFRTYRDVLSRLPDAVVFYPGHDYSTRNVEFALSLEPGHPTATAMLERFSAHSGGIVLTTLGEERTYNPFFRFHEASLQTALREQYRRAWDEERAESDDDDEATFRTTRRLRNSW